MIFFFVNVFAKNVLVNVNDFLLLHSGQSMMIDGVNTSTSTLYEPALK